MPFASRHLRINYLRVNGRLALPGGSSLIPMNSGMGNSPIIQRTECRRRVEISTPGETDQTAKAEQICGPIRCRSTPYADSTELVRPLA